MNSTELKLEFLTNYEIRDLRVTFKFLPDNVECGKILDTWSSDNFIPYPGSYCIK